MWTRKLCFLMVCLAAIAWSWCPGADKGELIPDGYPPITEKEQSLAKVPGALGAPAVVLRTERQSEWTDAGTLRMNDFRRVKILTEAGIERYGSYVLELYGEWRVKKVQARTILPDGNVVDASNDTFEEKSESGVQTVRVAFPKVQVGAILDLRLTIMTDEGWLIAPWVIQEAIPVISSRFILIPPAGLKVRAAALGLTPEKTKPESVRLATGKASIWTFENVEALPDEPNLPSLADIAQTLFVIPEEFKGADFRYPIARDWKSYSVYRKTAWDNWIKKGSSSAAALAKQVTEGKATPVAKAEEIRKALKQRVRSIFLSAWASWDSPDTVLSKGSGTSGEIAGTAVAMLRAVGIDASLGVIRRRSSGMIPLGFPLPAIYNDLLVRIPGDKGPLYFSPIAELPVGQLPWDCTFILVIPFDGHAEAPDKIDDFEASQNKTVRTTQASIDANGTLSADSVETYQGIAAERWRRRFRDKDSDARTEVIRDHVQAHLRGAALKSSEILNLEDDSKNLVVKLRFEVESYAAIAGKRLLLNPNLFSRMTASDWAAAERKSEIDLGSNFEEEETVTIVLPENVADVTIPPPVSMKAGPVGIYEASWEKTAGNLVAKRHVRLDMHRFPIQAYAGLRRWFTDIAAVDAKPLALALK